MKLLHALLAALLAAMGLAEISLGAATERLALSLRETRRLAETSPTDERLRHAGGIGDLLGFVLDRQADDVILFGRRGERPRPLELDDLAALLRCAQMGGLRGPGVSLEPTGEAEPARAKVVFFGGAAGNSVGRVSFEADLLMKKVALDNVASGVDQLRTYARRYEERLAAADVESWNVLSRFWFKPLFVPVDNSPARDIFLCRARETQVNVEVELLKAEINGVTAPGGFRDEPAVQYADQFRELYDRVARQHEPFADLKRYFVALKLMLVLLEEAPHDPLVQWLTQYRPAPVEIPAEVPLVTKQFRTGNRQMTLVGGVRLGGMLIRLQNVETDAIRDAVLLARPSPSSLAWTIRFDRDWWIERSGIDETSREMARHFSDALDGYEKAQYARAVNSCDQILKLDPRAVEAKFLRALAVRDRAVRSGAAGGEAVVQPFRELVSENPRLVECRYELGSTLRVLGRTEEAVEELTKAVQARPDFPEAHHALGLAYSALGNAPRAADHLRQFLRLTPDPTGDAARDARRRLEDLDSRRLTGELRWQRFADPEHDFACRYPADWKVLRGADVKTILPDMADAQSVAAAFVEPARPDCHFFVQVTPIDADALSDQDIADALAALDQVYKARLEGFQKVEAAPVSVGGVKGIRYVLKCRRAGVPLQQCIVTLVHARKAYTLTFTAPEQDYPRLEAAFKQALAAFQTGR